MLDGIQGTGLYTVNVISVGLDGPRESSRDPEEHGEHVVIIGAGEQAEIAYEYLTHDSPHRVVAFAVEGEYLERDEGYAELPVVPLESLHERYDVREHKALVAVSSTKLNRVRTRLYLVAKEQGYDFVSYVSSRAFVWPNVQVGENTFVFEHTVLQHNVRVGDNVVLWSGSFIGHRTVIHDHCFVAPHAGVSGYCEIGESSFLGVNCCLNDYLKVGEDCVIGSGAVVIRDCERGKVYVGNPARALERTSYQSFGLEE